MTRRRRMTRGALVVLAVGWMLATPASVMPVQAQASWRFQLEWTQPGEAISFYRLCVNGDCRMLTDAHQVAGGAWRAGLPMLPPGEYRLVVEACNVECVAGEPDIMIRVLPSSSRRPPIDVIDGPRIPVYR